MPLFSFAKGVGNIAKGVGKLAEGVVFIAEGVGKQIIALSLQPV